MKTLLISKVAIIETLYNIAEGVLPGLVITCPRWETPSGPHYLGPQCERSEGGAPL